MIASQPLGWLPLERLPLPPGGGELPISDDRSLVAEVLGRDEAYVVRTASDAARGRRRGTSPGALLSLRLLGRDRAEAELSGRQQQLRLRHSEIITLLCSHPAGLTSEELSEELYGDGDRTGGIRVEISRLRKLLGDCIETDRYRLRSGVVE